jgi:hypothetical protein
MGSPLILARPLRSPRTHPTFEPVAETKAAANPDAERGASHGWHASQGAVRVCEETIGTRGRRHALRGLLSSTGRIIIVIAFDVLDQRGQFLEFHGLLIDPDIHDSQDVALPGAYEFFER